MNYDIVVDRGEFVFYSKNCNGTASSCKSTRCVACQNIRINITQIVQNAEPLGLNNEIKNYRHIAQHPLSAAKRIRDNADQIRRLKKKITKHQYEINMLKDHFACEDDKKLQWAINKTFEEANKNFQKFQMDDQDGTEKDQNGTETAGANQSRREPIHDYVMESTSRIYEES